MEFNGANRLLLASAALRSFSCPGHDSPMADISAKVSKAVFCTGQLRVTLFTHTNMLCCPVTFASASSPSGFDKRLRREAAEDTHRAALQGALISHLWAVPKGTGK